MDQNNTVPKDAWLKDLKDGDRFAGYYLLKTVSSATAVEFVVLPPVTVTV